MEKIMSNQVNYKQKYEELKMKYMQDVDTAFRLGFEQGSVQAQQDQMMQQQQAEQELAAAQAGGIPGQGGGSEGSPAGEEQMQNPNGGAPGQMEPDSENPAGSEFDQHIAKLESMISKSETTPEELKKAVEGIKSLQVKAAAARVQAIEMKKSYQAIPGIAKALHKPAFKIGKTASHNLTANAKQAVGMQEKIVTDIMKSWEEEEKKATSDITKILNSAKKD
jgi:hypothetical protein